MRKPGLYTNLVLMLLLATVLTPQAWAGEESSWYVGLGLGQADDDQLAENDTSWKFFTGYQVNKYLGLELGYVDLGDYIAGLLSQDGFFLDVIALLPLGENFAIFAKAGAFSWSVELSDVASDTGTDGILGLGAHYRLRSTTIRIELERFLDVAGGDVDLISAGLAYRF